jgi:hypothetical protein
LNNYDIFFAYPEGMDTSYHQELNTQILFKSFAKSFFDDIWAYNILMLSRCFYEAFDKYDYLLIYQTDSYVFRDDLKNWASLAYDYIGGISFVNSANKSVNELQISYPGNGGLSLRKVESFMSVLADIKATKRRTSLDIRLLRIFNKTINLCKKIISQKIVEKEFLMSRHNEDEFIVKILHKKLQLISIPTAESAISFSWDTHPAFLMNLVNELPFGCHGWYRKDHVYKSNFNFWKNHIQF